MAGALTDYSNTDDPGSTSSNMAALTAAANDPSIGSLSPSNGSSAGSSPLDQYSALQQQRDSAAAQKTAAIQKAMSVLQNVQAGQINLPLLAGAAQLGAPTHTGSFSEAISNAVGAATPVIQQQRQRDMALAQAQGQLGIEAADIPLQLANQDANTFWDRTQKALQTQIEQDQFDMRRSLRATLGLPGTSPATGNIPGSTAQQNAPVIGYDQNDPRNEAALASLPDDASRNIAITASKSANVPLPTFIALGHQESGWNLNAPNGSAGEIGPLQVKPGTGSMVGVSGDVLKDPAVNAYAGAAYFRKQLDATGGNVPAAVGAYNSGDPKKPNTDYADSVMKAQATYGSAVPTNPAGPQAASNVTAVGSNGARFNIGQEWQRAQQYIASGDPGFIKIGESNLALLKTILDQGIVPSSDGGVIALSGAAQAAAQKAGLISAAQLPAKNAEALAKEGLMVGPDGTSVVPIPGYSEGVSSTKANVAGAVANAEAPAKIAQSYANRSGTPIKLSPGETVTTGAAALPPGVQALMGRFGVNEQPATANNPVSAQPSVSASPVPNAGSSALPMASNSPEATLAATTPSFKPTAPLSKDIIPITSAPPDLPPSQNIAPPQVVRNPDGSMTSTLNPFQEKVQAEAGEAIGKIPAELTQLNNSQLMLSGLMGEVKQNAAAPGWYQSGAGNDWRQDISKSTNAALSSFGLNPLFDPNQVAYNEEFDKNSKTASMQMARTMSGGRVALGEVLQANKSVPNLGNTPYGNIVVTHLLTQDNLHQADRMRYQYEQAARGVDPVAAGAAFDQLNPASNYVSAAAAGAVQQAYPQDVAKLRFNPTVPEIEAFNQKYGDGSGDILVNQAGSAKPYFANAPQKNGQTPQIYSYDGKSWFNAADGTAYKQ